MSHYPVWLWKCLIKKILENGNLYNFCPVICKSCNPNRIPQIFLSQELGKQNSCQPNTLKTEDFLLVVL